MAELDSIFTESGQRTPFPDIDMPEMKGLEMMLELTKEFWDVKVIASSGSAEGPQTLNMAKLVGARQMFQKPFDMKQLLSSVHYDLGTV